MDYTLCGCHPLPQADPSPPPPRKNSNSIGRQLSKLVGVMKLKLSRSSSSEGKEGSGPVGGEGEEEPPFGTLKTFGRSTMLRPPPRSLSSFPPAPASSPASPASTKRKEKNGKKDLSRKQTAAVRAQYPHPDVFAGSHPSNHDVVRYTARSDFFWRAMVVGRYLNERKEKQGAWEKAHLGDGKGKEEKKKREVDVDVEVGVGMEGVSDGDGHGHTHLGYDAAGNEVPPWGVFLLPVPIHFENDNGGRDPDQGRSCVSVDANQVKMMGGCASVSIGLSLLHFNDRG